MKSSINRALVLEYFLEVSRMEYALKSAGYLIRTNGDAMPNWDKFAKDASRSFRYEENAKLEPACLYYRNEPPKKQVVLDGNLTWKIREMSERFVLQELLLAVRDARNNLFHGGKFNPQDEDETVRNETLLRYGILILEAARLAVPSVSDFYSEARI